MARIFISHSSHDNAVAEGIMEWLRSLGFDNAFLDIDEGAGIHAGDRWEARLYEELAACSAVVLLVTPQWLASKWCFAEFVQARATGKAIFPIIMTPDGGQTFASDLQRVDFTADPEKGKRSLAQRLKDLALDVQSGFDWDARRPPYPGLPAFEREDAAVYFGRDPEVRDLIEALRALHRTHGARMLAVLGASGSGKSSLVRAGVLPRLAKFESDFAVVAPIRPGTDPCAEIAKALAETLGRPSGWSALRDRMAREPDALRELVTDVLMAAGRREGTLLVTVDQAEELFTVTPPEARARFETWLRQAADLPLLVLLTLRSDRLGELQQWAQAIGPFEQFSLPPLPFGRLAEVIEGPARVSGATIAPGVVDAIVHDAGGADAMPLLAFTLRELWGRAQADAGTDGPTIRLADYTSIGDAALGLNPLENAVRRRADALVAPLDPAARQALRAAFVGALARIDDQGVYGRRAAAWDELDPAVQPTLEAFVEARLLVARSGDDGRRFVEVAHESLLRKWPLLRDWLDEERGFLLGRLQLQRALDDWQSAPPEQAESALLQGLMLERARVWLAEKPTSLSRAQREFIAASLARAQARRQAARRRWIAIGSAGVIALTVITGLGVYLRQEREASSALAVEVETDRWLQRSVSALAYGQPDRALVEAVHAYRLLPGAKTRSAVWQAGVALPPQLVFDFPEVGPDGALPAETALGGVSALAWSTPMDALLVGDRSGALHELRIEGGRKLVPLVAERRQPASKDMPEAVLAVQAGADGARLAVLEDGRIVRQRGGGDRFEVLAQVEPLSAASISAAGDGVLALTQAARQPIWLTCAPRTACSARPLPGGLERVTAATLDPHSARIAAADASGRVFVTGVADNDAPRAVQLALGADVRIQALALDARAGRLAAATSAGEIVVLDRAGRETARLPTQHAATRLAWAPGGERLATDCEAESLCIWRLEAGGAMSLATVVVVRGGGAAAIAWSDDGQRLAAGDVSGRLHVWDLATPATRAAVLRAPGAGALADIDVHPDGRRVVAADARGQAYVWDLPSQRLQQRLGPPVPAESRGVRFHPVQPQLALATLVGGASVIALDGGAEIGNVEGSIEVLRWEPQGRLLTGGQDGVVRSHAVGTGSSVALPEPHRDAVVALAVAPAAQGTAGVVYSADTRGVIVAHGNGESGTVATATNAAGKPFSVDSLSFAPDGKRWIAAGNSGDVLVFDRTTRQVVKRLETAADQVNAAAFSPDGNFVAALDNAGRLLVWHGAELNRYATLWLRNEPGRVGTDAFGLLGQLRKLAWLPDSRRIAVATQNGAAVVVAVPIEAWLPAPR